MIQTNIKKLFENAGAEMPRPTDQALEMMNISRKRFTLLAENRKSTPITVQELEAIKAWIENIKSIDTDQIIGDFEPADELAISLGLTK